MKKIFISLFFFVLILVFCYYAIEAKPDWEYVFSDNHTLESLDYNENVVTESFGLSIFANTDPASSLNKTHYLSENESLKGRLQITNAIRRENEYLIISLVDYEAVPFSFNGTKNTTHLVTLDPMEAQTYSFEIDNLTASFHDILIITFLNPFEHSLDRRYRISTDFGLMGGVRLNAVVGNSSKPLFELKDIETLCDASYPLEGILVNKQPCSPTMWIAENVTAEDKLDYFINIGNNEERGQRTFAVIQFLDYEQISLNYNSTELVYYGQLRDWEKGSIPATLIVPQEKGVHELMIVWISDPYENIETSPGVNSNIEGRAEPSMRIGLNVS